MALLARSDLRFVYHWPAVADRPGPIPFPNATALDRGSGPAVLGFVNGMAALSGWTDPALGWKVEAMLRAMPPPVYTQQQAYAWVAAHWNTFGSG